MCWSSGLTDAFCMSFTLCFTFFIASRRYERSTQKIYVSKSERNSISLIYFQFGWIQAFRMETHQWKHDKGYCQLIMELNMREREIKNGKNVWQIRLIRWCICRVLTSHLRWHALRPVGKCVGCFDWVFGDFVSMCFLSSQEYSRHYSMQI